MTNEEPIKALRFSQASVERALHSGMASAVRDFSNWTHGEYLGDWGVEGVLTSGCARALSKASAAVGAGNAVTLEQTFLNILEDSGRRANRGRPSEAERLLAIKTKGRVDIVLWNRDWTPRAMIELKRNHDVAGLEADAHRVMDFALYAGRAYSGSVRYGLVATVISGPPSGGKANVIKKGERRRKALAAAAEERKMRFSCSGPRWLGMLDTWGDEIAATYVFAFNPRR